MRGQYVVTEKQEKAQEAYNFFLNRLDEGYTEREALAETEELHDLRRDPVVLNKVRNLIKGV